MDYGPSTMDFPQFCVGKSAAASPFCHGLWTIDYGLSSILRREERCRFTLFAMDYGPSTMDFLYELQETMTNFAPTN